MIDKGELKFVTIFMVVKRYLYYKKPLKIKDFISDSLKFFKSKGD